MRSPGNGTCRPRKRCRSAPTDSRTAVVTTRPFRAPHHTISDVGLIGGGQPPMMGEVSLEHHGLLLVDERPACTRHVLEVVGQPLEEGITLIPSPACPRRCGTGRAGSSEANRRGPGSVGNVGPPHWACRGPAPSPSHASPPVPPQLRAQLFRRKDPDLQACHRGRTQAGHRAVRRSQGLDGVAGRPRPRGGSPAPRPGAGTHDGHRAPV